MMMLKLQERDTKGGRESGVEEGRNANTWATSSHGYSKEDERKISTSITNHFLFVVVSPIYFARYIVQSKCFESKIRR